MTSRSIVIDANIARAAGPEFAVHPTSKACRDLLLVVKSHRHMVVFSKEIRGEWDEHQSGFATLWRAEMVRRGRVVDVENARDDSLRTLVCELASNPEQTDVILKDIHLFEAAGRSGNCIASIETRCFDAIEALSSIPGRVCDVEVVNPKIATEALLRWLRDGAKSSQCRSPHCRRLKARPRSA